MPSFCNEIIKEIQDKEIKDEKNGEIVGHEIKEIGPFSVKTYPLGFRGAFRKIKFFRNILYSVPYTTGSVPKFRLIVEHTSNIGVIPFTVFISQERNGKPMPSILYPDKSTEGQYIKSIKAPKIAVSGEYKYSIGLASRVNAPCNYDIVVFAAFTQERIIIVIYSFVFAIVAAVIGSLLT